MLTQPGNTITLPHQMSPKDRVALEKAGVIFGFLVTLNGLFVDVTLPKGWKVAATDDHEWSALLDDKGRRRALIFFRARTDDQRASLEVLNRFAVDTDYDRLDDVVVCFVTDEGRTVFTTQEYYFSGDVTGDDYTSQRAAATDEAEQWLQEHYPNWEDPSAYWD